MEFSGCKRKTHRLSCEAKNKDILPGGFFGGGDMNGIKLLFPEIAVRIVFVVIGIIHGIVIWKYLLPEYTNAFRSDCDH